MKIRCGNQPKILTFDGMDIQTPIKLPISNFTMKVAAGDIALAEVAYYSADKVQLEQAVAWLTDLRESRFNEFRNMGIQDFWIVEQSLAQSLAWFLYVTYAIVHDTMPTPKACRCVKLGKK